MRTPRSVRKEQRRYAGAAVSLCPIVRWQSELLQALGINGGEESAANGGLHARAEPVVKEAMTLKGVQAGAVHDCENFSLQRESMLDELHGRL